MNDINSNQIDDENSDDNIEREDPIDKVSIDSGHNPR